MEPFRDDDHAALIRAARLEDENARLRAELAEARKPKKPADAPKPRVYPVWLVVSVLFAMMGLAAGVLSLIRPRRTVPAPLESERKVLVTTIISSTPVEPPPKPDWASVTGVTSVDLRAYAQGNVPAVGYAVGKGGTILRHYADGSAGWTVETSGTTRDLYGVGEMLGVVCAVGEGGIAVCARDPAKVVWKVEPTGTHQDLLGAEGFGELTAVGRNGTIVYRDADGWSTQASGTKADLYATAHSYAVGAGGVILRREGHASKWTAVPSGTKEDLFAVAVENHAVVVIGAHGTILRLKDPRDGFRAETTSSTQDLHGVTSGNAGYDFIAVGAKGTILRSLGDGTGWQPETGGGNRTLWAVRGSIPTMFIVGDSGTMLGHRY